MTDFKQYVARRVLVFTDFLTFEGTLDRAGKDTLTLANAAVVADDGGRKPVDGLTVIPAASVQWVQVS